MTSQERPIEEEKLDEKNEFMRLAEEQLEVVEKEEEKQEVEIDYRLPELVDYFGGKQINRNNYQSMVNNLVKLCHLNCKEQIQTGITTISPKSKELSQAIGKNIQKEEKELSRSRISESPPPNHKEFMERMKKARKVGEKKRQMNLQYEQSRKQAILKKQEEQAREEQEQKRIEREKAMKQKIEEYQKKREQEKEQRMESIKRYKSVIGEKRRHELMAQKYQNSVKQPLMEERNKILEERSRRFKGYSIDEIRDFEREYMRKQQERASLSRKSKQQWDYTPPPIHPRLHQILQEEKIRERVKMEEKKRALEQKIARKQYYAQYLKETISVKIDQKKKMELERLNAKPPQRNKSKSQRWKLGNNYLSEVRSKVKHEQKKDSYSTQEQPIEKPPQEKLKSNTSMSNYVYEKTIREAHEHKINKLLSSNSMEKSDKLDQLKLEVEKLNERAKRKQEIAKLKPGSVEDEGDLEVLLSSIKAKIGIMHLYKH